MVVPHRRYVERVAGLQLRDLRVLQRFLEARKFPEIRRVQIDHAHGAASRRIVDRAQVEIAELLRRKEGESATPDRDACEIVRKVVVGGDARPRSHPDAGEAGALAELDVVRFVQTVEEVVHVDRRQIDWRRIGLVLDCVNLRENVRELRLGGAEVHPHRVVIEQLSAGPTLADRNGELRIAALAQQIVASFAAGLSPRFHQRPSGHESANDERLVGLSKPSVELLGRHGRNFRHWRQSAHRPGIRFSHCASAGSCAQ